MTSNVYWQDVINLLLGIALFVSPWFLGFQGDQTAAWNAHIFGVIIAIIALAAMFAFYDWEEWINALLGAWVIIAPWVLGFSSVRPAMTAHVIIGIITLVLALWSSAEHRGLPAR